MADKLTPLDQLLQQSQGQGIEGDDLANQYQELIQSAPPEVIQQAHAEALAQLSDEERQQIADTLRAANDDPDQAFQFPGMGGAQDTDPQQLAAMFGQAQSQQPDLLNNALGLSGGGSNPLMQMVITAVIQMVMSRMLGGGAQAGGIQTGGLDLGSILGQVLGGAAGGAGGPGSSAGQGNQGGGMSSLDDLLNQAGGQTGTGRQADTDDQGSASPMGGGGLADILGQLAGGGGAGGGLGSILGQLAGGLTTDQDDTQPDTSHRRR